MKHRILALAFAAILLAPAAASADTLSPFAGGTGWTSWTTSQLHALPGAQPYFWNNFSQDLGECNVGYWISGTSGCNEPGFYNGPNLQSPTPDFYGAGTSTFAFQPTGQAVQITVGQQVSAWEGVSEFGWYATDLSNTMGAKTALFGGTVTPNGSVFTFVPTGLYGFYIESNAGTFTTGDTDTEQKSHFAVFDLDGQGGFIIGVEDNRAGGADFDYNDIVFTMDAVPVPEPASMLLLGTGLLGVGGLVRRRVRK